MVREYNIRTKESFKKMEEQFLGCANYLTDKFNSIVKSTNYECVLVDYSDKWMNFKLPSLVLKSKKKVLRLIEKTKNTPKIIVSPTRGYDCSFNIESVDPSLDSVIQNISEEAESKYPLVSINFIKI
jgi:hypothetical protein